MRIETGILSALLTTLNCLYPGLVVEDVLSALVVGAVLSIFLGMFFIHPAVSLLTHQLLGKQDSQLISLPPSLVS